MARPALTLSLQFADPRHRDTLARHKVARWIRAALQHPQASLRLQVWFIDDDDACTIGCEPVRALALVERYRRDSANVAEIVD